MLELAVRENELLSALPSDHFHALNSLSRFQSRSDTSIQRLRDRFPQFAKFRWLRDHTPTMGRLMKRRKGSTLADALVFEQVSAFTL